jgi:hypothetical protein
MRNAFLGSLSLWMTWGLPIATCLDTQFSSMDNHHKDVEKIPNAPDGTCTSAEWTREESSSSSSSSEPNTIHDDKASCTILTTSEEDVVRRHPAAAAADFETTTTRLLEEQEEEHDACGLWVALSTIPGAGIGMYAGTNFQIGDPLLPHGSGDHVIPIVDLRVNHPLLLLDDDDDDNDSDDDDTNQGFEMLEHYTWEGSHMGVHYLGHQHVEVLSPGVAAVPNCIMDLVNVDEGLSMESVAGDLHRSRDPGAGAFTYYHSRQAKAIREIEAGQELFVNYGNNW